MSKHYIKAFIMIAVSVLFGISAFLYESSFLSKVSGSFTSITALYILFGIILDKTLIHKVPSKKGTVQTPQSLFAASRICFSFCGRADLDY